MNDPIRSRIRSDILSAYAEPSPDLTRRVLHHLPGRQPQGGQRLQVVAVTVALLLIAAAVLIARGTHLWSLSQEASHPTGLRPPVAPYSIVDAQFISGTTGWMLVQLHATSGPTVLLKTSDGGAHWVEQFRNTGSSSIQSIHFSANGRDGTMAWLVNQSPWTDDIYKTHDGGGHWQLAFQTSAPNEKSPPPAYSPVGPQFFLDDDTVGWQLRVPTSSGRSSVVMHTSDSGRTWAQVGTLPNGTGTENGQFLFTDSQNGWFALSDSRTIGWDARGNPLPSSTPPALLYVTHNGGQTWTALALPLPGAASAPNIDVRLSQPVMFDSRHGLIPIQLIHAPSGSGGATLIPQTDNYVLQTSDGGNHWTNPTAIPGGPASQEPLFFSTNHWLIGNGALLSETTDEGKTWSTRRVLVDGLRFDLSSSQPTSPMVIWAQVGAGSLIRSTDGGRTWLAIAPPQVH